MTSSILLLHLLLRASDALQSAAGDLGLTAAFADDPALSSDARVIADAAESEAAAVDAVIRRLSGR
jgi:hypothetical protein